MVYSNFRTVGCAVTVGNEPQGQGTPLDGIPISPSVILVTSYVTKAPAVLSAEGLIERMCTRTWCFARVARGKLNHSLE